MFSGLVVDKQTCWQPVLVRKSLAGAVAVFTGNLTIPREHAADLASRLGMEVKASVSRQTTHLILGDQDLNLLAGHTKSSKHRRAEEMRAAGHPIRILGDRIHGADRRS